PQNLLGRVDSRPQSPAQDFARKRADSGNLAEAPLVGLDLAWVHLAVSRRLRSRTFFAELQFATRWRGGPERRVTRPRPDEHGGGAHLCSAAASSVSENADHYWHSPWRSTACDGRRTSPGNAARAMDSHYT